MRKSNRFGSRLFIGLTFLFLYLPIFLLIVFSFNAGESSAVWQGFSLDWYVSLFRNRLIMPSAADCAFRRIFPLSAATIPFWPPAARRS